MNVDEKNERWQNLVGKKLEEAIEAVKADGYKEIRVIEEDEPLSEEVIPTRVTIFVNENGMVTYVPRVC